ncbi:MAG: LysE family transporter [Veillonellaceae bacterium]|jgi:threonine/homoserine/homoserine lactone efflux protein|nr:LysE family transporter [Veillonellaceae bacterium]
MWLFAVAGLSLGFSAGISPGPLFAMVIAQTLRFGLGEGLKTAISPLLTDIPIIFLSVALLAGMSGYQNLLGLISLAGGLFLLHMAYASFSPGRIETPPAATALGSLFKGALVNALSPHPYLFWIMVGGPIILNARTQGWDNVLCFVAGFYLALIGSKIGLALLVNRSRRFLQGKAYLVLMKIMGTVLLLFAFLLLNEGVRLLIR